MPDEDATALRAWWRGWWLALGCEARVRGRRGVRVLCVPSDGVLSQRRPGVGYLCGTPRMGSRVPPQGVCASKARR